MNIIYLNITTFIDTLKVDCERTELARCELSP